MTMTRAELRRQRARPIELLELVSLEGRRYMARFRMGRRYYVLADAKGRACLFEGACAARNAFRGHPIKRSEVIPPTETDEMIGMPVGNDRKQMHAQL